MIRKVDLELPNVNFLYLTNPLNEQSSVISRVSNVESFADSINDIIKNERFDSEYIDSIK